jgi:hypothetical protein
VDVGDMSETPHRFHLSGRDGDIVDFLLTVDGGSLTAERANFTPSSDIAVLLLTRARVR